MLYEKPFCYFIFNQISHAEPVESFNDDIMHRICIIISTVCIAKVEIFQIHQPDGTGFAVNTSSVFLCY